MFEGLRGYVQMAAGLGEVTAARAKEVAGSLLSGVEIPGAPAGASGMATQVAGLAEDLLSTAKSNRGALVELVQKEAEQVVHRLGVVTAAEAEELKARISALEAELAAARSAPAPRAPRAAANASTATPAAKKPATTKAPATRAPTKKATATKTPAKRAAKKAPATRLPPNAAPGSADRG